VQSGGGGEDGRGGWGGGGGGGGGRVSSLFCVHVFSFCFFFGLCLLFFFRVFPPMKSATALPMHHSVGMPSTERLRAPTYVGDEQMRSTSLSAREFPCKRIVN